MRQGLDFGNRHFAGNGNKAQEILIRAFDGHFHDVLESRVERQGRTLGPGKPLGIGASRADRKAVQRLFKRRHHAENSDRSRNGHRIGDDFVGGKTNPVAAACRHVTHADDNGLAAFSNPFQFPSNHFTGNGTTSGAIDAHDKRCNMVIALSLSNQFPGTACADLSHAACAVTNIAFQSDHSNTLLAAFFDRCCR